ncbi:MAG TPA: ABC transporter permease [Chloroflexota bacterium]
MSAARARLRLDPVQVLSVLVGIALVSPTLIVLPMSLTSIDSFKFPPPGWSTQWYVSLATSQTWRGALLNSVVIACVVALLATGLGTAAALALARGRPPVRGFLNAILISPLIVPTVIAAVGMYLVALNTHIVGTFAGFVLAHTCLAIPLVVISVAASLQSYDTRMDWAAASLGATPWGTFRSVTLPLIAPGMFSGAVFAFVSSFDETVVALFLVGPSLRTLPVLIYEGVLETIDPRVAAASTLLFMLTTLLLVLVWLLAFRRPTGAR